MIATQVYGIILLVSGLIVIIIDIFKSEILKKSAIIQQIFSPRQCKIYMRILGGITIAIGIYLLLK